MEELPGVTLVESGELEHEHVSFNCCLPYISPCMGSLNITQRPHRDSGSHVSEQTSGVEDQLRKISFQLNFLSYWKSQEICKVELMVWEPLAPRSKSRVPHSGSVHAYHGRHAM